MSDKQKLHTWLNNNNSNGWKYRELSVKKFNHTLYDIIIKSTDNLKLTSFQQKLFHYMNDLNEIPKCDNGFMFKFTSFKLGYSKLCIKKCNSCKNKMYAKIAKNNVEKYGVSNPMKLKKVKNKQKENNLKKYGVNNVSQIKSVRNKISFIKQNYTKEEWNQINKKRTETNINKYGVEHTMQSEDVKEKRNTNNVKKYGVKHVQNVKSIKEKQILSYKKNKERKFLEKHPEVKEINNKDLTYTIDCKNSKCELYESCVRHYKIDQRLYKQRIYAKLDPCIIKHPLNSYSNKTSKAESSLYEFINRISTTAIKNDRTILDGKELDIFIPDYNLGLEFNGLYWHSELYKDQEYHKRKALECRNKGISLFHIWEDDWLYKRPIIESMIKSKLHLSDFKIGARKCQIKQVSSKKAKEFLDFNHLQGNVNSSVRLGLWYDDKLVLLATFGKKRKTLNQKHTEGEWELYRFASSLNTNVVGGFSRLLKYFINNYKPSKIFTYASLDHSNGDLYRKSGFNLINITNPGYYWIIDGIKKHRFNFTKHKLVKEGADPNLTESEIMYSKGSYRVWDSGNLKFELSI